MWLRGIWGTSASNVFAVGESGTILHYDGSGWSPMNSGTTEYLYSIWGSSGTDIYSVGAAGTILHFNGSRWSPEESGTIENLRGVWSSSETDMFIVGDNSSILHFDGSSWSPMESGSTAWLLGIWGSSGTDVFAVGGYYNGSGVWFDRDSWDGGVILHYDGSSWSEMKNDIAEQIYSIWGSSANDIFSVGAYGTILHYQSDAVDDTIICAIERIYGGNSRETEHLRCFRDNILSKTPEGRELINLYYQWSPVIVKAMEGDEKFKEEVKEMIGGVLTLIGKEIE